MAKTNLRSYTREIESLIDQNNINEAIAHCKYILKLFPKSVDTYRLLGKAYLEDKRFTDATDLFQRVLSVFPDDFIGQIGMSIIRENEGNLDASIWHMERAFEVQPSNSAIQDELKRLYGRRDGVQPPKVRLTRGALVRMYARGELYPQAIAEAKVALVEEPDRIDIAVILAKMHSMCSQKMEATAICNQILIKLPYCFDANQILFEILPETSQEERKVYQQRLFAINPYSAYLSPTYPTVSLVPDLSVVLERLEYTGEMQAEEHQPEWAQSVGADLNQAAGYEKQSGDWLPDNTDQFINSTGNSAPANQNEESTLPPPASSNRPVEDTQPIIPSTENEDIIPDWMRTEGWIKTDQSADDIMASQSEPEPDEALPADMPPWFKGMEPEESNLPAPQKESLPAMDDLTWLQEKEVGKESEPINPPDWLVGELSTQPDAAPSVQEVPSLEENELPQPISAADSTPDIANMDLETGMAWLEELGRKQNPGYENTPAAIDSTIFEPAGEANASRETAGDFSPELKEGGSASKSEADPGFSFPESMAQDEIEPGSIENKPDWLQELEMMPDGPDSSTAGEQTSSESAWQLESQTEWEKPASKELPDVPVNDQLNPVETEEIPDWLRPDGQVNNETPDGSLPGQPAVPEGENEIPGEVSPTTTRQVPAEISPQEPTLPEWITSPEESDALTLAQIPAEKISIPPDTEEHEVSVPPTETLPVIQPEMAAMIAEPTVPEPIASEPVQMVSETPEQEVAVEVPVINPETSIVSAPVEDNEQGMDYLALAHDFAESNQIENALSNLNLLIQNGESLEKVVAQLLDMVYRHPVDPAIWQTLGDAYFKSNQLQAAINAYSKAEELIR